MKILITGGNKNQGTEDFYLRQQLKVVPSHYSLVRCLRDMGHEVDQRIVTVGEDLSSYDQAIVYLVTPQSLTASHFYNMLWTVHQFPNAIIAYDDWQIDSIFDGIRKCHNNDKQLFKPHFLDIAADATLDEINKHSSELREAVGIILEKKNKVLISAFAGGDVGLVFKKSPYDMNLVYTFNPNPYHLNRKPGALGDVEGQVSLDSLGVYEVSPNEKIKQFNFASLVQARTKKWLKTQNITWPVEYFGARAKDENQRRLTEGEMCKVYEEQWGCLMPGYFHSGSGWWRARPLQVADANSILIGEEAELFVYYKDKELSSIKASDIEQMDITQLSDFARRQKEAIYSVHPLDKRVQQEELRVILES